VGKPHRRNRIGSRAMTDSKPQCGIGPSMCDSRSSLVAQGGAGAEAASRRRTSKEGWRSAIHLRLLTAPLRSAERNRSSLIQVPRYSRSLRSMMLQRDTLVSVVTCPRRVERPWHGCAGGREATDGLRHSASDVAAGAVALQAVAIGKGVRQPSPNWSVQHGR
jgi:hypothetical protein